MRYSTQQTLSARLVSFAALVMVTAAAGFVATKVAAQGAATHALPALAAAGAAESAPAAGVPQPARWTKKKIFFIYMGIQTNYTCQSLTDDIRQVLLQLGARKSDIDVHETGCTSGFNAPTPHPGVAGTFYVLEPVAAEQANGPGAPAGTVAAHWQPMKVQLDPPGRDVNGQCELLDQVKHRILPLFATRDVQYQSTCFPHEEIVGGTSLRLQVLMPDFGTQAARE
jgi:hypothetical protein